VCAKMDAKVCHGIQVVVHDPQGVSKGMLSGLASGLSVVGFGQSVWRYLGEYHDGGSTCTSVDQLVTVWTH